MSASLDSQDTKQPLHKPRRLASPLKTGSWFKSFFDDASVRGWGDSSTEQNVAEDNTGSTQPATLAAATDASGWAAGPDDGPAWGDNGTDDHLQEKSGDVTRPHSQENSGSNWDILESPTLPAQRAEPSAWDDPSPAANGAKDTVKPVCKPDPISPVLSPVIGLTHLHSTIQARIQLRNYPVKHLAVAEDVSHRLAVDLACDPLSTDPIQDHQYAHKSSPSAMSDTSQSHARLPFDVVARVLCLVLFTPVSKKERFTRAIYADPGLVDTYCRSNSDAIHFLLKVGYAPDFMNRNYLASLWHMLLDGKLSLCTHRDLFMMGDVLAEWSKIGFEKSPIIHSIKSLVLSFEHLNDTRRFALQSNKVKEISPAVDRLLSHLGAFKNLKILSLSGNRADFLQAFISDTAIPPVELPHLEKLSISNVSAKSTFYFLHRIAFLPHQQCSVELKELLRQNTGEPLPDFLRQETQWSKTVDDTLRLLVPTPVRHLHLINALALTQQWFFGGHSLRSKHVLQRQQLKSRQRFATYLQTLYISFPFPQREEAIFDHVMQTICEGLAQTFDTYRVIRKRYRNFTIRLCLPTDGYECEGMDTGLLQLAFGNLRCREDTLDSESWERMPAYWHYTPPVRSLSQSTQSLLDILMSKGTYDAQTGMIQSWKHIIPPVYKKTHPNANPAGLEIIPIRNDPYDSDDGPLVPEPSEAPGFDLWKIPYSNWSSRLETWVPVDIVHLNSENLVIEAHPTSMQFGSVAKYVSWPHEVCDIPNGLPYTHTLIMLDRPDLALSFINQFLSQDWQRRQVRIVVDFRPLQDALQNIRDIDIVEPQLEWAFRGRYICPYMSVTASEQLREVPIPFWLDHSSDGRAVQYRNKLVLLDCVDKYLSHKMTSLQNANFPNLEILSRTLSRSDSLSDEVDSFKRSVGSAEEFARCLAYNLLFECAPPHLALHKTQELSTSYLNVHPVHFDLLQDFLSGLPRDFRTRFHTLQMPIKAAEAHIQYPSNYHPFGLSYAKNPYWLDAALGISTEEMWQDSLVEVLHVASVISKPSNTDASRALVVQTAGKRSAQTSAGQPRLSFVDPTVVPSDVAEDYDPKRLHDVFNKKTVHFDNSTHLSTEQQAVPDQTQTGGSSSSYVESAASSFSVEDSSASTSEPMASSSSSGQQEEHLFQSKHGASSHSAGTMSASP